jgi:hypothetical protein
MVRAASARKADARYYTRQVAWPDPDDLYDVHVRHKEKRLAKQKEYYHEKVKPARERMKYMMQNNMIETDSRLTLREDMKQEEEESEEDTDGADESDLTENCAVFSLVRTLQDDADGWSRRWGGKGHWKPMRSKALEAGLDSPLADEVREHIEMGRKLKERCERIFIEQIPLGNHQLLYDLYIDGLTVYSVLCRGLTILHGRT